MDSLNANPVSEIPLENPASIRRHLPTLEDGCGLSHYLVGPENSAVNYLFDPSTIRSLHSLSPIVLYGEKGTGKSVLAISLAVQWSRLTSSRPLCFTTGQAFAADYAADVEIDDVDSFRARHRKCKLLVIDDLQPIATKEAIQQELIHTIDALSEKQAPLIISLDKLPASLSGLKPALASRLTAGYALGLQRPGAEAAAELLRRFIADIDASLPFEPLYDLCLALGKAPKTADLKSIVTIAHQNKTAKGIDLKVTNRLVQQFLDGDQLPIATIAKSVARKMGVKLSDMRGSTREASIVRARGVAILLARRLTPASLQQIGQFFGGRDHSTILHAFRKTSGLLETDPELAQELADIQSTLLN